MTPNTNVRQITQQSFIGEWYALHSWSRLKPREANRGSESILSFRKQLPKFKHLAEEVIAFDSLQAFVDGEIGGHRSRLLAARMHTVRLRYIARLFAQKLYGFSSELPQSIEPIVAALVQLKVNEQAGCPYYPCERRRK